MSNKKIFFSFLYILFFSGTNVLLSMEQQLQTIETIASYRILSNSTNPSVHLIYETLSSVNEYCVEKTLILKVFEELDINKKNNTINLSQKYCPYNKESPLYLIDIMETTKIQKTFYISESLIEEIKQNLSIEKNSNKTQNLLKNHDEFNTKPFPMITNCQTDWKMDKYKPHVTVFNGILNEISSTSKTKEYYTFDVSTNINKKNTNFTIQLSHQDVQNLSDTFYFEPNNQIIIFRDSQNCPCIIIPTKINPATTNTPVDIQRTDKPTIKKKDNNKKYSTNQKFMFFGFAFLAIAAFVTVIKLLK